MIEKFSIDIPQKDIEFLNKKLATTRWPDELDNKDWADGTNLEFLKDLCGYWASDYNWREHEKTLNDIGSYKFFHDDGYVHFLHSKSDNPDATNLILTHGWPGSIQEFIKLIKYLKENHNQKFNIVCPSLPGFGFSSKPKKRGTDSKAIAIIQNNLMLELGYEKYIAQGGDWGATVSKWMADLYPDNCIGLHLNLVIAYPPDSEPMRGVTEQEIKFLDNFEKYKSQGYGYYEIQKTKPQTIGYLLNDSPAGLAAWISEKFYGWFEDGSKDIVISIDELLSIISLYWFTESGASSARLYKENNGLGFSFNKVS
ncbi:epoxide hydrolase 1, partial [Gammaproteobacteria bacterium]|nr:epoxide hydrolase 1 [Gammaproteobacteria bacterium]